MKHKFAFIFLICLVCTVSAWAAPSFPALTGRIVDEAALISPATEQRLANELENHEQGTGEQVVIVTLPGLQGLSIDDFGYQLGRHWGIGQKGKDNGALLIVVPSERSLRIEAGYGVEDRLTDAASAMIINRIILPMFRKEQFEQGIVDGTHAILATLGKQEVNLSPENTSNVPSDQNINIRAILFLLFIFLFFFRSRRRSGIAPFILGTMLGSSGGRRSGGFGSGRFGGGGGSFGGGGASGRW